MSLRNIIIEPDPILREKSLPVEKVDSDLQKLLNEMLETMYAAPGIGLAAVQVGILKRLIVIDISKEKEKKNPLFLINFCNSENFSKDISVDKNLLTYLFLSLFLSELCTKVLRSLN